MPPLSSREAPAPARGRGRSGERRPLRQLPPPASRQEHARLALLPVRALEDRPRALPQVPARPGARVPRLRAGQFPCSMTVVPSSPTVAFGALRDIWPLNSPEIGALPEAATAFALPYSPAFTRQHSRYTPALTAETSQRKVALRPAASGPSGYVSTNADERSSGAGSSGGFTRSVAVGVLLTTNCGRSVSAALGSAGVVFYQAPRAGAPLTPTPNR